MVPGHKTNPSQDDGHPADKANPLSFATFSWMNDIMSSHIVPSLSPRERVDKNVESLLNFLEQGNSLESAMWSLTRTAHFTWDLACNNEGDRVQRRKLDLVASHSLFSTLSPNTNLSVGATLKHFLASPQSSSSHTFCVTISRHRWDKYVKNRVYITTAIYLSSIVLGFVGPTIFMRKVLTFTASSESGQWEGLTWVGLLIICEFGRVLLFTLTWALSYRTALRLKAATMGLVYRKLLRVQSLHDGEASKMINVIGNDCSRVYDAIVLGQVAIGGPVVLVLSAIYIVMELGWWALLGMIVFPLAYPVQYLLARWSGFFRQRGVEAQDARVSFLTQSLHHLKFIKMFGWEQHFHQLISKWRAREIACLRGSGLLGSMSTVLGPTLPHIGVIITFLIYLNSGILTPAQGFTLLALLVGRLRPVIGRARGGFRAHFDVQISLRRLKCFTILFVFSLVGYSVRAVSQLADLKCNTRIATQRLQSLLHLPEVGDVCTRLATTTHADPNMAVTLENAMFRQKRVKNEAEDETTMLNSDDSSFQLRSLNVAIKRGNIVGVCGSVGSGKSTLLEGVAGCLTTIEGYLHVVGRIAFVPQTPWLFKGTIRDNIVFGEPFDSIRYYNTVDACCLTLDFGLMSLGDLTEIDGKGSNLSGGQRQRVALARAVYSFNRDVFVLDDPFSALDAKVANTIWERVGKSLLRSYTLIVSTHNPNFLEQCDQVLLLHGGTISMSGTHQSLLQSSSHYAQLLHSQSAQHSIELEEKASSLDDVIHTNSLKKKRQPDNTVSLPNNQGAIPLPVILLWVRGGGGVISMFVLLCAFALSIGSTAFSSWWLKQWFRTPSFPPLVMISNNDTINSTPVPSGSLEGEIISAENDVDRFILYRNVYATMIGVIFITALLRAVLYALTSVKASKSIHQKMSSHLFRTRLKSVDRLGFGQLLNLFSRDIGEVDWSLPTTLEQFLQNVFIILAIFSLVSIVFPVFLVPLLILSIIFIWVRSTYKSAIRILKRIETEAKTPIFTKIGETIEGLASIRSFGKQTLLTQSFYGAVDEYHAISYTLSGAIRWLAIRLDCLAVGVTGATALLVFLFHGSVSAAAAGLALAYSAQLSGVFQFTVRLASETEAKFVSIERIHKFLTTTPTEEIEAKNTGTRTLSLSSDEALLPTWPYSGRVKFDEVTLTYSSNDRPALSRVSFEVAPGQTVGVVGRTGSGKSSLGNALFRLNELWNGTIFLDDIDISTVSVKRLRESLCVISQEPAVFSISVRHNLDPGGDHGDSKLWEVLRKVGLDVESLDSEIGLSLGEHQLLAVARALLRNAKVVFIDEATSNVDADTGSIVDRLLATEFADSTVFLVAHRMSALSRCDVILVLEGGQVRDFGPVEIVTRKPGFIANFDHFESVPL